MGYLHLRSRNFSRETQCVPGAMSAEHDSNDFDRRMISIGGLFVGTIRWNNLVGATSSEQEETVELRVIDLAAGKM